MSGAQKISLSLLISVIVFSALAVLAAVDRFQIIETRFYVPRVEESVRMRAEDARDVFDRFHRSNIAKFEEFTLDPAIRAAFRINASATEIRERQNRLDAAEQDRPSLDLVRIIDVAATQLHYSSNPNDFSESGTQRTYDRPDVASTGEPRSLASLAYYEELPETQALPSGEALPTPEIFLEPESNQFIYRLPAVDTAGVLQGAALFYVNTSDLRTALIRSGLIGTGDVVRIVNPNGVVVNAPTQFSEGVGNAVAETWAEIANLDGRETVTTERRDEGSDGGDVSVSYEAFPLDSETDGVLVFLEPAASLEMPELLQYTLLVAVFLTTFLIVFLLLNVRQDAIVVISDRVKRFQISMLREYMERRRELDFQRWKAELEDRRDEVQREIRRGIGRIKPSQEEEVDRLINESWDEIISVLSSRAEDRPTVSLDVERIEEIVDQLSRRLEQSGAGRAAPAPIAPSAAAPAPPRTSAGPPPGTPVEVEDVAEDDELEEAEEPEEVEPAEELEAADEAEELEPADELEEAEEPEEAEAIGEAAEADELEEAEEAEEAEEPDEAEPADELEETTPAESPQTTGAGEEVSAQGLDRRGIEVPPTGPGLPAMVSLENLDEAAELEWLARAESDELPGPVFSRERYEHDRAGLEEGSIADSDADWDADEPEETSYRDTAETETGEAGFAEDAETAPVKEAEELDELEPAEEMEAPGDAQAVEEVMPLEEVTPLEEAEVVADLEPVEESGRVGEGEDEEELEELEPEEAGGAAVEPEELPSAPAGSTTFGGALFSFGRGIEVRPSAREPEPGELEAAPWASATEPAEGEAPGEVESIGEVEELEEIDASESASAAKPGRRGESVADVARPAGSVGGSGLIRFEAGREGSGDGYESASLTDVLDRLHIDREVLVENEGVVEIDRSAYAEGRAGHDEEMRSLVESVVGEDGADTGAGIESLFGGGVDELLSVMQDAGDEERRARRADHLSLFRFGEQGFDYDGFLRGYQNNEGGVLKSLVRFTRVWNARVGIVLVEEEHELVPAYQLGLDPACAESLGITKSSGLYRHVLSRRNVVFIERPITDVEYFHGLCSSESLGLFDRTLLLPMVFRGTNAYAMLGLPRSVESLEAAFRAVVPHIAPMQGVPT